jgi:hypothetical protein
MKYILAFCFGILFLSSFSQHNTDVYIFDIQISDEHIIISDILNVSNNDGYDNQPSFLDKNTILYSSSNKNQTDIAMFDIKKQTKTWLISTESNEYSPLKSPIKNSISSIRMFKNGDQHLYSYDIKNRTPSVLIDNLQIGYHVWYSDETVILSIIEGNTLALNVANITDKSNKTTVKNIGRSLAKIPKTNLISYVSKASNIWEIRSYDPLTNESKFIINTLQGSEDFCWTPNGVIIMAKGNELHKFNPKKDDAWKLLGALSDKRLTDITRLSVNSDASKLALVVENE